MKPTADLLSSFDDSWKNFSDAWKKARTRSSEKSIHALRVSTRRMIATLELASALSKRPEISDLQRKFKKVLKSMGPLRDTQVLLENLTKMQQGALISDFKKVLERRERRKIDGVRSNLKRGSKQRLTEGVKEVRSEFSRLHDSRGKSEIERSVERVLTLRRNEFLKAERRFHKSQPINDDLLHEMRIALKKLRYAVEAAQPVLGESAKRQSRDMHDFQTLIGESRDLEMLRAALEKWADKNGKKIAIVPALDSLQEKRAALLNKIFDSSKEFEERLKTESAKPAVEKTHVVDKPAAATAKVAS
jgi:CHAD domain-containing protein